MADEVNASFMLAGEPAANVAAWRAKPPPFLVDYKRVDESYESLVYEANVTTMFMKVTTFGIGKTLYRLTFTFRADGGAGRDAGERARPGRRTHRAEHGRVGCGQRTELTYRTPPVRLIRGRRGSRPSWSRTRRR